MTVDHSHSHDERTPLLASERRPSSHASPEEDDSNTVTIWKAESWLLFKYSAPLIATYLLQYGFTVITTIVAGHLSTEDLAAASLGLTTKNIIGYAFFEGMATALDTLCAQAYGSGNLTGVGLHVQRMALLMTVAMIPIGGFWLFSPSILPLLVPQHDLAVKAGIFLQVNLIGLPGYAFFEAGKRFLQAQGDFKSGMVVLIICTPVNALLSWFFAVKLDMGLNGAALGQAIANDLCPVLLYLYVVLFGRWSLECWGGWSWSAFREWGPMVRLATAGTALNLAEWLAFEVLSVSSAYIDANHLAAQTVLITVSVVTWHIPFSISVAVSTRVGVLIGAGSLRKMRQVVTLYAVVFVAVGIVDAIFLFSLRNQLGAIFSEDSVVRDIATKSMAFAAVFHIIDSINCGCNGVLRGMGRQSVAAWVAFLVSYGIAVPLAIWLALGTPDLKLDGQWIGLGAGMLLGAVIECVYLRWMRWQDCVDDVKEREGDDL
ncbi:mate-domain-containing protein [Mariannaea sp. PMI_226]|nr:mate-domain-containing protein [Mariannaea sp. PMI_226]